MVVVPRTFLGAKCMIPKHMRAVSCHSAGLFIHQGGSDVAMDKYVSSAGSDFQPWDSGI